MSKSYQLLGITLTNLSKLEIIQKIEKVIAHNSRCRIEGINVAKIQQYNEIPELKKAIDEAELVHIDGTGLYFGARLLGIDCHPNYPGIDLMLDIIKILQKHEQSIFLLGATGCIVERTSEVLEQSHNVKVAGFHHGYFSEADEQEIVDKINQSNSTALFIGITSPKKELFLHRNWEKMNTNIAMGVGGSFDVISGELTRAPKWMQKCGLEWLYRVYQEPNRLWKRYLISNTLFLIAIARQKLRMFDNSKN